MYYTSGYATNLLLQQDIPSYVHPKVAVMITDVEEQQVRRYASGASSYTYLRNFVHSKMPNFTIPFTSQACSLLLFTVNPLFSIRFLFALLD